MRLFYSCHNSFPCSDTNTQQIFWTLLEVARLGIDVELSVPAVESAGSLDARAAIAGYYGATPQQMPATFTIVPIGRPAASAAAQGWFDWRIPSRLASHPHDLVWTRDPLAVLSCARAGLDVVFETYRPDFATHARFSFWRRACLRSGRLRGVIVHSQLAARAFVRAGVLPRRCLVAHNGFAPSLMEPRLDRAQARARLGLPTSEPLVVYAGHVGRKKGTDALVRMAAAAPNARIVLLGVEVGSAEARRIDEVARTLGVGNLLLRRRVPLSAVAAYLYAADCLVIPPTDEPLARFGRTVLPMKIFMYLAAGRPADPGPAPARHRRSADRRPNGASGLAARRDRRGRRARPPARRSQPPGSSLATRARCRRPVHVGRESQPAGRVLRTDSRRR